VDLLEVEFNREVAHSRVFVFVDAFDELVLLVAVLLGKIAVFECTVEIVLDGAGLAFFQIDALLLVPDADFLLALVVDQCGAAFVAVVLQQLGSGRSALGGVGPRNVLVGRVAA